MAGVLHHLGVDMGRMLTEEQLRAIPWNKRRYRGYEDADAYELVCSPAVRGRPPEQIYNGLDAYLYRRLKDAKGPVGCKVPEMSMIAVCDGIEDLPITVVHADRDMNATFESDIKYRGLDYNRAAMRGILDLALRVLLERIPPVCTIRYEEAIKEPGVAVARLMRTLELKPDVTQTEKAIASIDPTGCKWE